LVVEPASYSDNPFGGCPGGYAPKCCTFMGYYACCEPWMEYDMFSGCVGYYDGAYVCPGGYNSDGGSRCYRGATFTGYSCPSGGSPGGATCTITQSASPVYTCPNGGTLSGSTCMASCVTATSPTPTTSVTISASMTPTLTRSPSASATPTVTITTTISVSPTTTTTTTVTASRTVTPTVSITPSPSFIHRCGIVTIPQVACNFTDTQANCRCTDGLYSETGVPEFTLTCDSQWKWPPLTGHCYKCTDPGDPFFSTRLGTTNTAGYLTSITHECKAGYWNSLTQEPTATAECQTTGHWSPLISCAQCRIPEIWTSAITQTQPTLPGVPTNAIVSRIATKATDLIGGFAPAHKIYLYCAPLSGPVIQGTVNMTAAYPALSECQKSNGTWLPGLSCVSCRSSNTRRRCSNPRLCSRACAWGPWNLPNDLHTISQYA